MPQTSAKKQFLQNLDRLIFLSAIHADSDDSENEGSLNMLLEMKHQVLAHRYIYPSLKIPKTTAVRDLIWLLPPDEFKQAARLTKESFQALTVILETHPVFQNNSRNPQEDVWVQTLATLERLGCSGNGASLGRISRSLGISVGAVCKYTDRVIEALLSMKSQYIRWPKAGSRHAISEAFEEESGIRGIVGIIDGTHIHLSQRPAIQGEAYFTRKRRYSINVQLVCDHTKKITFVQTGWPGSVHDQTAFSQSKLFLRPSSAFSPGEFLLGDSGYALSNRMLTPYRSPAANHPDNQFFNVRVSSARVKIEHVNGILKNRFSSLKEIRLQVKTCQDFKRINNWITACCILHNFAMSLSDPWEYVPEENEEDPSTHVMEEPSTGTELRERIKALLIQARD